MFRPIQGSMRLPITSFCLATSCHGFHDWAAPQFAQNLMQATQAANVARIGFLRHGNTLPTSEGNDFERQLSDIGKQQALEAGQSFGKQLQPFHPFLLVSPAPRTMETARLFCQGAEESVALLPMPILYDGTMQPGGSAVFRKLGYAPLRDYLENENKHDRALMNGLLGTYARETTAAILDHLQEHCITHEDSADRTLWVVGHAVYLPSVVLGLAHAAGFGKYSTEVALSTSTKEAEAYLVDFKHRCVQYMERPSSRLK